MAHDFRKFISEVFVNDKFRKFYLPKIARYTVVDLSYLIACFIDFRLL